MFGRSKKKQAAQQPQQMQVSPEALALLQAMQAGQQMQQMQQQQMQQQMMMQPQMQQPQMMPTQMQQPQMQQPQMMPQQMAPQSAGQMPQAGMADDMAPVSDQNLIAELGGLPPQMPSQEMPQQGIAPQAMPQEMPQQGMPQQGMAQQGMAQQGMAPQAMMQQGMAPQAPLTADSAPPAGFPFATQPSDEAAEQPTAAKAKKGKLTREEKRAAAAQKKAEKEKKKAEKLATAKEKAEEKKRAKRRKKLAKTRFSRARYLREANGNAIAGVVLWIFMILIFIIGPFMLNTAILIPQTNENLRILSELESLKRSIVTNRPQIAAMAETRKARRGQITAFTSSFVPRADAAASLEELAQQLEAAGLEVKPLTVAPFPLVAQAIIGTSVNLEVTGSYVDWLLLRNKFIRSQRAISIPTESIAINPETGLMEIRAQIILPSSI